MANVTIIPPSIQNDAGVRLRVAAYCRVSSSSADQLNSYMAQMTYYQHKFEDSEREQLIDIYADEGITGTRDDKRIEFQRMITDCRKGKIDRIYTKSISRFARNTKDCLEYLRELKSLGITVYFEKENIDTARTSDEMIITILGGLAQEESVSISQNVRWALQKQMQNGTYLSQRTPFGFRRMGHELIIDEKEAVIVRRIFAEYLAGNGAAKIAGMLEQEGIFIRKEGTVSSGSILHILKNERYMGDSLWMKHYIESPITHRAVRNQGERDQYYVSGTNPAIVSKETFQRVQSLLAKKREQFTGGAAPLHLLSKMLCCGICGSTFKRKQKPESVNWVCRQQDRGGSRCTCGRIPEAAIYAAFIHLHNKLFAHQAVILQPLLHRMQELGTRQNGNANVLQLRQELAALREQKHVLASLRTKGFLPEQKYQEQTADLNRKIAKQQHQLHLLARSENDEQIRQLEQLAAYFENRECPMMEFESETFGSITERITVHDRATLDFHLIGGLTLTEHFTPKEDEVNV